MCIQDLWQRFVNKFLDYWIGVVVVALASVAIYAKDWLLKPIAMWPVVPAILVLIIGVLSVRLYRLNPKTFKPFPIRDVDLNAIWWVRNDPKDWTTVSFDERFPNSYTNGLLDGPFCGARRSNGDLCLGGFRGEDPTALERCGNCNRGLFVDEEGTVQRVDVDIPDLKLRAIIALQRESRRGKRLGKNFSFGVFDLDRESYNH